MNNLNNMDLSPKKKQELLKAAAAQLGTSPEMLAKQLESGKFDKALGSMPKDEANMLVKALSDKATAQKILSSPQAQAIYKKLSGS